MNPLVRLLATWFGSGLLPRAPGTWGSLAALPPAGLLMWLGGPELLAIGVLLATLTGCWISTAYVNTTGREDPGEVVIDEVAGQWIPLVVLPFEPLPWIAAFVAFRFFDIAKPWPVSWADQRLSGGLGIMADDILAGIYAAVLLGSLWMILEL